MPRSALRARLRWLAAWLAVVPTAIATKFSDAPVILLVTSTCIRGSGIFYLLVLNLARMTKVTKFDSFFLSPAVPNLTPRSLIVYLYIGRVLKTCSTFLDLYIHYILMLLIFICECTLFFTRTLHRKPDILRVSTFYKEQYQYAHYR
jgi:hypothetical protein